MILYLSSNENINTIDFLSDEAGMVIKKLSGMFSLNQFVLNDMRSFTHYSFLVLDYNALTDPEDEFIEAILAFKRMYSSRVVLIMNQDKRLESLIYRLLECDVTNLVFNEEVDEMKTDVLKAVSDLGISKRELQGKLSRVFGNAEYRIDKYDFSKENVRIGVAGTMNRVGATTMALNLTSYLSSIGARVCYVEANTNGHLKHLFEGMELKVDGYLVNGVRYLTLDSLNDESFDFIIYDMGVVDMRIKHAMINNCDEAFICTTYKSYERDQVKKAFMLLENDEYKLFTNFASESEQKKLIEMNKKFYKLGYLPNQFDTKNNSELWLEVLNDYIESNDYARSSWNEKSRCYQ